MYITLRMYRADDIDSVVALFRDTIHTINKKDYSEAQVNAWAPAIINSEKWGAKLLEHHTVIAECNTTICGFGDIDATGYFDHLFVHKDFQGLGIATKIVRAIEDHAALSGFKTITVAVSITAKTFFLQQGYEIVTPQQVTYNGEVFTNYAMKKEL
jgi:putative acetyltransferase